MGFLNTLTDVEQDQLKGLAADYPIISKLCNELKIYESDVTKEFYAALKKGISNLTSDIHSGLLDADNPYTKSMIKLAESGDKIFNTLKRGNEENGEEKLKDETKQDSDNSSIIDQRADANKKKL